MGLCQNTCITNIKVPQDWKSTCITGSNNA